MADGKVEVELRLLLDKAKQDLVKFAKDAKSQLQSALGGGSGGSGDGGSSRNPVDKT